MWNVTVHGELHGLEQVPGSGEIKTVADDQEETTVHVEGPAADGWPVPEVRCRFCPWSGLREELEPLEEDGTQLEVCPECGQDEISEATPRPIHWCNSAGVRMRHQEVVVSISLGDPRGALTMTAKRTTDGRLLLFVPHPGESFAHVGLRELRAGAYEVVSVEDSQSRAEIYEEALREIDDEGPPQLPEYQDWGGDTEEAERWGLKAGAFEAAKVARKALEDAEKLGQL